MEEDPIADQHRKRRNSVCIVQCGEEKHEGEQRDVKCRLAHIRLKRSSFFRPMVPSAFPCLGPQAAPLVMVEQNPQNASNDQRDANAVDEKVDAP